MRALLTALVLLGCTAVVRSQVDSQATLETVNLYNGMKANAALSLMYGQHNALSIGNTIDETGNTSDCKSITGEHPGVVGFDFVRTHLWDPVDTNEEFYVQARAHYLRGGVITFSWHMNNPSPTATGDGRNKDTTGNPVQGILTPGSTTHANFNAMLDEACSFFHNLEAEGIQIPVIWRPFHENSGSWFWWGADHCTPAEFQQLWQYTYDYMTHTQGLHNLLWAYSPSKPASESEYLERYPGDSTVDLIGFDYYGDSAEAGHDAAVLNSAQVVSRLAAARGKICAQTEGGESNGFDTTARTNFFTGAWLNNFQPDPDAVNLAYVLTWTSPTFSTFESGPNAHLYPDFINFYESSHTVFADDIAELYGRYTEVYEAEDATLTGVDIGNSRAGFSGTGYITRDSFTSSGDQIEFAVTVPDAGSYALSIRYNAPNNKVNFVDVNGVRHGTPDFPNTDNTWQTFDYGVVDLNAGINTITLRKSWGWMDVDSIRLRGVAAIESTNDFDVVYPESDVVTFLGVPGLADIYSHTTHNSTNTIVNFHDARASRTPLKTMVDIEVPASGEYDFQWWNAATASMLSSGSAVSTADGDGWKLSVMSESFDIDLVFSATQTTSSGGGLETNTVAVVDYQFNDPAGTQLTQLQNDGSAGEFDANATDRMEADGAGFLKWQNTSASDGSWRSVDLGAEAITNGIVTMEWRLDSWSMTGLPKPAGVKMVLGDSTSGLEIRSVFEVDDAADNVQGLKIRNRDSTPSHKGAYNIANVSTNGGDGYVFRVVSDLDTGTAVFEYRTDSGVWTDLTPDDGDGLPRIDWVGVQMTGGWINNPAAFALVDYLTVTHETVGPAASPYAVWLADYPGLGTSTNLTDNPDGDALDNEGEFIAGTDPTDPNSVFTVTQFDTDGFVIHWNSVSGRVYSVDWTDDLMGGFTNIADHLAYPQNSYTDTVERTESGNFYRINVQKP